MSGPGSNIVMLMGEMTRLFTSVSLLLKTADVSMRRAGWMTWTNQCVSLSTVPEKPDYWFPQVAFRFYKNEQFKSFLAFISVIFDSRSDGSSVPEALLSAGWHDFGPDGLTNQPWKFESSSWHPWMPGRVDDGSLFSVDPRQAWPAERTVIHKTTTFGIPLVNVASPDDLNERIVSPLLRAMEGEKHR
jgi:hypothetical protein